MARTASSTSATVAWSAALTALLALVAMTFAAVVQAAPQPAQLDGEARADIARIEDYLNGLGTMKARFVQVGANGGVAEGTLYISRPGRFRLEYDPPVPILMVGTGGWLIYHDSQLRQTSHLPLRSTPAWLLVRENLRLSGDVTVTGFERSPGALHVAVVATEDPASGTVILTFADDPLALRSWTVIDAQGLTTEVALTEVQYDVPLARSLFNFTDPAPTTRPGD